MTPEDVISHLGMAPLEPEGGWWSQSHIDAQGSTIHYLLTADQRSLLHQLPGPEVYFHQAGAPLDLLVLRAGGRHHRVVVGPDLDAGQRIQFVVPGRCWQGSTSTGEWTLVGTAMAPPFRLADYRAGVRSDLVAAWPAAADRIVELTDP